MIPETAFLESLIRLEYKANYHRLVKSGLIGNITEEQYIEQKIKDDGGIPYHLAFSGTGYTSSEDDNDDEDE